MAKSDGGEHKGHRKRMREKFLKNGFDTFADHEILEMLLYYSIPRANTNSLAHRLLDKYKTLANVFDASPEGLMTEKGISEATAVFLTMIPKISKLYEASKETVTDCLASTDDIGQYAVSMFKDKTNLEEVAIICLCANRRVKWSGIIRKGTVDKMEVYPEEIAEIVLRHKAKKIVLVHNHPNGTLAASVADKVATEAIVNALKGIRIEVLDHIIVSGTRYFSMKESGFRF